MIERDKCDYTYGLEKRCRQGSKTAHLPPLVSIKVPNYYLQKDFWPKFYVRFCIISISSKKPSRLLDKCAPLPLECDQLLRVWILLSHVRENMCNFLFVLSKFLLSIMTFLYSPLVLDINEMKLNISSIIMKQCTRTWKYTYSINLFSNNLTVLLLGWECTKKLKKIHCSNSSH